MILAESHTGQNQIRYLPQSRCLHFHSSPVSLWPSLGESYWEWWGRQWATVHLKWPENAEISLLIHPSEGVLFPLYYAVNSFLFPLEQSCLCSFTWLLSPGVPGLSWLSEEKAMGVARSSEFAELRKRCPVAVTCECCCSIAMKQLANTWRMSLPVTFMGLCSVMFPHSFKTGVKDAISYENYLII